MSYWSALFASLVFPGLLFSVAMAFWFQYLERKIVARIQRRIGPLYTGPHGLFQPLYDFLKMLFKEEIVPEDADKTYYRIAPILATVIPVYGMAFIPVVSYKCALSFEGDFLFTLFLFSLSVFTTAIAGYAVYSPYSSVGVGRLIIQYSIYESFLALSLAIASLQASSISFSGMLRYQAVHGPLVFYQPIGFVVAIVALIAKLEKPPFDLPHAKQEIVAGWMTEYSGRGLAFLKLSKDLSMVWGISLISTVYLGGPLGPLFPQTDLAGFLWFAVKCLAISLVIIFVRGVSGRMRVYGLAERLWGRVIPLVILQFIIAVLLRWYI